MIKSNILQGYKTEIERMHTLLVEIQAKKDEYNKMVEPLQAAVNEKFVGKMVKLKAHKGWNYGYIKSARINQCTGYNSEKVYISFDVANSIDKKSSSRRMEASELELLTEEETAERQRILKLHQKSNGPSR